jgi:hypothetical protein
VEAACQAFTPDQADLGGLAVGKDYDDRGKAGEREVAVSGNGTFFIKNGVKRQIDRDCVLQERGTAFRRET